MSRGEKTPTAVLTIPMLQMRSEFVLRGEWGEVGEGGEGGHGGSVVSGCVCVCAWCVCVCVLVVSVVVVECCLLVVE